MQAETARTLKGKGKGKGKSKGTGECKGEGKGEGKGKGWGRHPLRGARRNLGVVCAKREEIWGK